MFFSVNSLRARHAKALAMCLFCCTLFSTSPFAYAQTFDTLCDKTPSSCLALLNTAQSKHDVGSESWWELEATRLTWLFEFHQEDELYAALRPWINSTDVPSFYEPLISKLLGKWLVIRGRNDEAAQSFELALEGYAKQYEAKPAQQTALEVLNLLVALNRLAQAEAFVAELVEYEYSDAAFYREVFAELGHIAYRTDNHEKHVEYRLASLEWAKQLDDKQQIGVAFNNYGVALRNIGKIAQAKEAFIKGLSLATSASDAVRISILHLRLAEISHMQNDIAGAREWLSKADLNHLPASEFKRLRELSTRVNATSMTQESN